MDFSHIYDTVITWATTSGLKLLLGLIGLWVGWKVVNKVLTTLHKFLKKQNVDMTLMSFLNALVDISLKILLVVAFLSYVGIPMASFAAALASAGLALGLAIQGSLSNFAGGVIILLLRPFKVSDYIETSNYQGTVEKISIFYTSLLNTLNDIINSTPNIIIDIEPFIAVSELADSSVNFVVKVWGKTEDYWNIHYSLLESVKIKFDEEGISIPYPQIDVHLDNSK